MAVIKRKERIAYRYESPEDKRLAEQMAAQDVSRGYEYERPRKDRETGNAIVVVRNTRHFG